MGGYISIRPEDDQNACQASDWCHSLLAELANYTAHAHTADRDGHNCARADVETALRGSGDLVLYFGHGDTTCWLNGTTQIYDAANAAEAVGKAVVSIACKTSANLASAAVTAGVVAWLGFNSQVACIPKYQGTDHLGDAIAAALSCLGNGATMQQACDALVAELERLVQEYDTGSLSTWSMAAFGYFGTKVMSEHCVLEGKKSHQPLI
jgi:hypothetical protein